MNAMENQLIETSYEFSLAVACLQKEYRENMLFEPLLKQALPVGLHVQQALEGTRWNEGALAAVRQQVIKAQYHLRLLHDSGSIKPTHYFPLHDLLEELGELLQRAVRRTPLFDEH
jgi:hypothetical protein